MKPAVVLVLLGVLMGGMVLAAEPSRLQWRAPLEGSPGCGEARAVPLPLEVLRRCRPDLADLRIYDRAGREVPYLVLPLEAVPSEMERWRLDDRDWLEHWSLRPVPEGRSDGGSSVWDLGRCNLPLWEIRLQISQPAYFERPVEILAAHEPRDEAYQVVLRDRLRQPPGFRPGRHFLRLPQPEAGPAPGPYLRLRVRDQDSPPLEIDMVELLWRPRRLIFLPEEGKRYDLYLGAPNLAPPAYDLARVIGVLPRVDEKAAEWRVGPLEPNRAYRPESLGPTMDLFQRHALVVVVVVLILVLAGWLTRLVHRLPEVE